MKRSIATPATEKVKRGKGERERIPFSPLPLVPLSLILFAALLALSSDTHATLPEPDNLLYGNITLDGALVTAARTDVIIQARRTTNGPAIASYRMGANPALGNFYSLRLLLESVTPIAGTNASQIAESLFIVVTDGSGLRTQTSYTIPDRGVAQRVDFGAAAVDSDADGLPDAWELQHYANLSQSSGSVAPNGHTALQNFVAGAVPSDPASFFKVNVALVGNERRVSFNALRAAGAGYDGRLRHYALESSANPSGPWAGVSGFSDIIGDDQIVTLQSVSSASPVYYRGRVWLQP